MCMLCTDTLAIATGAALAGWPLYKHRISLILKQLKNFIISLTFKINLLN